MGCGDGGFIPATLSSGQVNDLLPCVTWAADCVFMLFLTFTVDDDATVALFPVIDRAAAIDEAEFAFMSFENIKLPLLELGEVVDGFLLGRLVLRL